VHVNDVMLLDYVLFCQFASAVLDTSLTDINLLTKLCNLLKTRCSLIVLKVPLNPDQNSQSFLRVVTHLIHKIFISVHACGTVVSVCCVVNKKTEIAQNFDVTFHL